ncbi:MAG: biotin/lipoyl-binding protein [Rhodospirillales bacterium]
MPVRTAVVENPQHAGAGGGDRHEEPLATVAVKSRIDGLIVEVGFAEGDQVTAGQVLFRLDDCAARAQLAQAEANVLRDQAQLADAARIPPATRRWPSAALPPRPPSIPPAPPTRREGGDGGGRCADPQPAHPAGLYTSARRSRAAHWRAGVWPRRRARTSRPTNGAATINQTRPIAVTFAVPQTELAAIRAGAGGEAAAGDRADTGNEAGVR